MQCGLLFYSYIKILQQQQGSGVEPPIYRKCAYICQWPFSPEFVIKPPLSEHKRYITITIANDYD